MRYMILVKATKESEAGVMPPESLFKEMADYHEQLLKAGVLVDASGLQATSKGFRVRYRGKDRSIVDGPFAETKELVAGYTIINVASAEEAKQWALKFPNPTIDGADTELEVRRFFELEDFQPSAQVERFKEMREAAAK
jgi:hypothetical protein